VVDEPPATIALNWNDPAAEQSGVPPDSISIDWNPLENSASDVNYLAERHCLAWDRHALQVNERVDGNIRRSEFVCRGPLLP
jgi:hypothetical protein